MRAEVTLHGTLTTVQPLDGEAKGWFDEHLQIEPWQMFGTAYVIEPRYLPPILEGFVADGGEYQ
jgi:hypothetical protein